MIVRSDQSRPLAGRLFFAFVILLGSFISTTPVFGHGGESDQENGSVRAVLDERPPALSKLRVQLRKTLAPQLLVANPTDVPLTVEGEDGRPFLRIGPDKVEGDLGAAYFHRTNTVMAPGAIPADASSEAKWHVVEATPNWGWFDLRVRTDAVDVPHEVVDAGERATIGKWSIPVSLGDTRSAITGRFEYVPNANGIVQAKVANLGALKGQALVRAMPGSSRPGVFLSYRGNEPLLLKGEQDEPFLRFSDEGVHVNRHSPTWAKVAPAGAPAFVDGGAGEETNWTQVSAGSSYGWIDPRLGHTGPVESPSEASVIKQWAIPVTIGGKESAIEGVTEWTPVKPIAKAD